MKNQHKINEMVESETDRRKRISYTRSDRRNARYEIEEQLEDWEWEEDYGFKPE